MKIAILSFFSGQNQRGVENWTHEIAQRLTRKGNKLTVFQAGKNIPVSDYQTFIVNLTVDWKKPDFRGSLARRLFADYWSVRIAIFTLKIIPKIWLEGFDILIPTNGGWQVALVRLITWLRGQKMVVVGHSGIGWDDANNLFSFPDVFVALTHEAQKWAKKINPFVKSVVIPNGVNLKTFYPLGKKAKIALPEPIILVVGALEPGKRIDLAIRAVSKLKNASLLVLGKGKLESKIKKLGSQLLGKRFLLTCAPHTELPEFYRACKVFTLPSWRQEAFGIVYLEALASGLPVVATDDSKRKEIIGNAGILVEPTDIQAYALALGKALRINWKDKPRKQAEKFDWERISEKYARLFENLLR